MGQNGDIGVTGSTMKTLFLLRHGKSDWNGDGESDHERPVAQRGRRAAKALGRFLANADQVPQRVLSSTAVRARTTAELAAEAAAWEQPVELVGELYLCTPRVVLEVVARLPATVDSAMLVGHEPTWSEATELLTGARVAFVTGAVVRIDLAVESWQAIGEGSGHLVFLIPPRLLDSR